MGKVVWVEGWPKFLGSANWMVTYSVMSVGELGVFWVWVRGGD